MGKLKKILVTLSVSVALLCAGTVPTQADITGAGDAALLAQQVIQFLNDMNMNAQKWADVAAKLDNVRRIVNTISNGQQAFSSVNNIINTSKCTVNTLQECEEYVDFITTYSYDKIRLDNAVSVVQHFARRSRNLYVDVEKTIARVIGSQDMSSGEVLTTLDKATSELGEEVRGMANETIDDLADMCHDVTVDYMTEQNRQFAALNIF